MSVKQSMLENKEHIMNSLPTQELKDAFEKDLEKMEEPKAPSLDEQVKEAQAAEHVSEDMYDGIKKELEEAEKKPAAKMSKEEEEKEIEKALKNVPKGEES
jgi:RNA polymerase-binding transcription factor DksA